MLWPCRWTDDDGQPCVLQSGHPDGHKDSGLRAWLEATTDDVVVRTYTGASANEVFQTEARLFGRYGFFPVSQSGTATVSGPSTARILTLGILAFGQRTTATTISVSFRRERPQANHGSVPELIRALGDLRDAGILTADEFTAKKAELLARL